ncbi:hypothetical protein BDR07DRAFT_860966 [Suillus spraguei]|nr:hypothetical protein BDR07DRAFT_860966 [Suillus spraguei]
MHCTFWMGNGENNRETAEHNEGPIIPFFPHLTDLTFDSQPPLAQVGTEKLKCNGHQREPVQSEIEILACFRLLISYHESRCTWQRNTLPSHQVHDALNMVCFVLDSLYAYHASIRCFDIIDQRFKRTRRQINKNTEHGIGAACLPLLCK